MAANKRNQRPTGPSFAQRKKQKPSSNNNNNNNNKTQKKDDDFKVVNINELNWSKVDINENQVTNNDFGGFFGLEEIEGVTLKEIDGKMQFVATTPKNNNSTNQSKNNNDEIEFDEEAGMEDLIEFKNMDDIEPGELSAASGSDDEWSNSESEQDSDSEDVFTDAEDGETKENDTDGIAENDVNDSKGTEEAGEDDALKTNVFNLPEDVLDIEGGDQPPILEAWNDLNCNLSYTTLQGLANLGFVKPTEIQERCIPLAIKDGNDILGKASTGSGKTLAYGIPILEKLVAKIKEVSKAEKSKKSKKAKTEDLNDVPVGLIFTPTRELAHQVSDHLNKLAKSLVQKNPYMILSLTGGLSIQKQERLLMKYKGNAKIVVATPGRFLEIIEKNQDLIKRFSKIEYLVLDEADRLLQDGHFEEFEKIMKLLSRSAKRINPQKYWQTLVFSATFSLDLFNKLDNTSWKNLKKTQEDELEQVVKHLMSKIHFKSKPVVVDTNPEQKVASQIKESLIECLPTERDLYVYYFVTMFPETSLVFCNSIDSVKKLNSYLNSLKISCFQIHSSMTQKNRLKNLERFKDISSKNSKIGKPTVLIASDVAARGLDISNINHVIHYHLPRTADVYIHRSGRTARGENTEGVSVMICSPQEAMGPLRKLRKLLHTDKSTEFSENSKDRNNAKNEMKPKKKWQKDVKPLEIETDIVTQLKKRSRIANEIANHEIASKSLNKEDNWLKQAADDLGIDLDSEDEDKDIILAKNKLKKQNKTLDKNELNKLKYELNMLLQEPIRKDLRRSYLTGGMVNLADFIVKNKGHNNIIGHEKIDALQKLKQKKSKK